MTYPDDVPHSRPGDPILMTTDERSLPWSVIASFIRYVASRPRRGPPCAACAFPRRTANLIWELRPSQIWSAACAFPRRTASRSRPKATSRSLSSPKAGAARLHLPQPLPQPLPQRSGSPRRAPWRAPKQAPWRAHGRGRGTPRTRSWPLVSPCRPARSMTGDQAKRRARRHRDRPYNMSAPTGADPRDSHLKDERFHPQPDR